VIKTSRSLLILALLSGTLVFGCRSGDGGFPFGRRANRPLRLEVENNNFLDVTVYASGSGARLRLGDVPGKNSGVFTIDPRKLSVASGLQIQVDPLGSTRVFLSQRLFPDRDASILLFVGAELELSYVTIR
jgi:hypothetical protein